MIPLFGNWRLKLLALVLAISLLAAVAFSENPPTFTTVPVKVEYQPEPSKLNLVLTKYQTTVSVPIVGLASAVQQFQAGSAGATVDLSHAKAGANQVFMARPKGAVPGVSFPSPEIPITLSLESQKSAVLDIEVRLPNRQSGIEVVRSAAVCGNPNSGPCQVAVTGPTSLFDGLKAFVLYDSQVSTSFSSPAQAIRFEMSGSAVNLAGLHYDPAPSWTPTVTTVEVDVSGGTATKTVTLTTSLTGTQACGYAITAIAFNPSQTVNLTGPTEVVSKVQSLSLDAIGISGANQPITVTRQVRPPESNVQVNPSSVQVTLTITRAFSCTAPTPSPSPSPGG